MKLDPGMHIVMHLVFFGKSGVTLRYQEVPIKILDTVVKRTRTSQVRVCRVQCSRHGVKEATWEREDALKKEFPHLFET
jgi:hypothetical protein